jgi:chromosomal replication initiator protein
MSKPVAMIRGKEAAHGALADVWEAIRINLRHDIGARSFDHWLKPASFAGYCDSDQVVRIALPSEFTASWVASHYAERLRQAWRAAAPQVRDVRIEMISDGAVAVYAADPPSEPEPVQVAVPLVETQRLDPRFTFSTFVAGAANQVAFNAARALAQGGPARFNPLYIHAGTGQGKTHLLQAIGHEFRLRQPGANIVYMSAERFMVDFVSAMRAKETLAFKTRLRSCDVLMIDDVQFIAGKDATQEEFLHTVDELLGAGKRLVISADRGPHALDGVEGRILSRLTQGLVVDIQPADYPLRRSILQSKVDTLGDAVVAAPVLDLLAARIASNIRELEGALNRLVAYASLTGRPIDAQFAEDTLADMFRASRRRITIDEIQRKVADHFRIRHAEMVSARRAREVARPRQIAMYIAKQMTPRSLPEIGRRFGGRDHTTVIHAVRQIEKLRAADQEIDADVTALMRSLEG